MTSLGHCEEPFDYAHGKLRDEAISLYGALKDCFILLDALRISGLIVDIRRNTWLARIKRTFTAVLPVSKKRKGKCVNCGACCKLPNVCPFLKYSSDGKARLPRSDSAKAGYVGRRKAYCAIYIVRPLNCRKYPRTESEFITADTCGYRFE